MSDEKMYEMCVSVSLGAQHTYRSEDRRYADATIVATTSVLEALDIKVIAERLQRQVILAFSQKLIEEAVDKEPG